jgi:hypothetical protein
MMVQGNRHLNISDCSPHISEAQLTYQHWLPIVEPPDPVADMLLPNCSVITPGCKIGGNANPHHVLTG